MAWRCVGCGCNYDEAQAKRRRRNALPSARPPALPRRRPRSAGRLPAPRARRTTVRGKARGVVARGSWSLLARHNRRFAFLISASAT